MIALMNFINFPKTSPVSVVVAVVCFIIFIFPIPTFSHERLFRSGKLNRIKILNLQHLLKNKKDKLHFLTLLLWICFMTL